MEIELVPSSFYHPDPYPRLYNWEELKQLVDCGDLGTLGRHPTFQQEYKEFNVVLSKKHGSLENYIARVRLGWDMSRPINPEVLPYFRNDIPEDLVRVIFNDWPYSVPHGVTHYVIWSRLPLVHPDLVPQGVLHRVESDGLWDFVGSDVKLKYDGSDAPLLKAAGREMDSFVRKIWPEYEWESAWFMNPTHIQSVRLLAHFHVFARRRSEDEKQQRKASMADSLAKV